MSKELYWLTLTVILTGLLWVPYILDRVMVRGLMGAMANPSPTDAPQSQWAQRLQKAHINAVENLVIFATLVLTLNALHHSTASTVLACAVYFWARLATKHSTPSMHQLVTNCGISLQQRRFKLARPSQTA